MTERNIIDILADLMLTPKEIRAELQETANLYLIDETGDRWSKSKRFYSEPALFRLALHTHLHVSISKRKFARKFKRKREVDKIVGQMTRSYKAAQKAWRKENQKRRNWDKKTGRYG